MASEFFRWSTFPHVSLRFLESPIWRAILRPRVIALFGIVRTKLVWISKSRDESKHHCMTSTSSGRWSSILCAARSLRETPPKSCRTWRPTLWRQSNRIVPDSARESWRLVSSNLRVKSTELHRIWASLSEHIAPQARVFKPSVRCDEPVARVVEKIGHTWRERHNPHWHKPLNRHYRCCCHCCWHCCCYCCCCCCLSPLHILVSSACFVPCADQQWSIDSRPSQLSVVSAWTFPVHVAYLAHRTFPVLTSVNFLLLSSCGTSSCCCWWFRWRSFRLHFCASSVQCTLLLRWNLSALTSPLSQ